MTILSIRSGDFDVADRVEAFRNVVSTMTRVDVTPDDPATFHSETSIAILTDLMIGHGSHSASTAVRTTAHAADAGDNVMFHIPLSGGCSIAQTGGETAELRPGLIYADPSGVAGVLRFHGEPTVGCYVSLPRRHLAAAGAGLDAMLRRTAPLTAQWRLLFGYARSLHRELPHLPPEDAAQSACHLRDLAVMALGATRDAGQIAMDAGFGDLSWFNARFKRCYGLSPRDVRARARRGD